MTPHIEAKKEEIANVVIMPGDPMRAKFIAEKFLKDYKIVSKVRGNNIYTGFYKGKKVSIAPSGMGMPSMGIYAYELYKFYDVKEIIRIGSAGAYSERLKLFDIVLTDNSYNEGMFAYTYSGKECHLIKSSDMLNNKIKNVSNKLNISLTFGNTLCTEVFEPYMTNSLEFKKRLPKELNIINSEMESFALLYVAKILNKDAACLTTISDSPFTNENMTTNQREKGFSDMITIALNTILER